MKLIALLCVIFAQTVHADLKSDLTSRLNGVISRSKLDKNHFGVLVTDGAKNELFALNADKGFTPASTTKLFTTAAVLQALQPDHTFHTQLWIDGEQTGSTLKGNIYLKGGGDPSFVSEQMWMLVNTFARSGIKNITGQIIADDSCFDQDRVDSGRNPERNARAYDAPVSCLSFNWNSANVFIRPGTRAGEKARVWLDPETDYVVLKSSVKTTASGSYATTRSRSTVGEREEIFISGVIPLGSKDSSDLKKEQDEFVNIANPPLFAGNHLKEFLNQRGITVTAPKGQSVVVAGITPVKAVLVADQPGQPVSKLIYDMNRWSNNYIAEMLAKNLGAFKTGSQGHMSDGLAAIREFIESKNGLGLDKKSYTLANVSGFSRQNSFTARQFIELLHWVKGQFRLYPEFVQSLAISGVEGTTLRRRMKDVERWVRAKSGYLTGVHSLAGYAGRNGATADESTLSFAFTYNGPEDYEKLIKTFDSMAAELTR